MPSFRAFTLLITLVATLGWCTINGRDFEVWDDVNAIHAQLQGLAAKYPHLIELTSYQKRYGLPFTSTRAGDDSGLSPETDVIIVSNKRTSITSKAHVLLIGSLNSHDILGTSTLVELVQTAAELYDRSSWMAQLLNNRALIIVPIANPQGFQAGSNGEITDLNVKTSTLYDFPIKGDETDCMRTVAARGLNEIYREFFIQMTVMMELGTSNTITYPWAHKTNYEDISETAIYEDLALLMLKAGYDHSFTSLQTAKDDTNFEVGHYGTIRGSGSLSFMDWAFGYTHIKKENESNVMICNPGTYDGYPARQTRYNSRSLASLVVQLEHGAQDMDSEHGNDHYLLSTLAPSGTIASRMRSVLSMADIVLPRVVVDDLRFDVEANKIWIDFFILGALQVDRASIHWHFTDKDNAITVRPVTVTDVTDNFDHETNPESGSGWWVQSREPFRQSVEMPGDGELLNFGFQIESDHQWVASNQFEPISTFATLRQHSFGTLEKGGNIAYNTRDYFSVIYYADNERGYYVPELIEWQFQQTPNSVQLTQCANGEASGFHYHIELEHDVQNGGVYLKLTADGSLSEDYENRPISIYIHQYGDSRKCHNLILGRPIDILPKDPAVNFDTYQDYLYSTSMNGGRPLATGVFSYEPIIVPINYLDPDQFEDYDVMLEMVGKAFSVRFENAEAPTYFGIIQRGSSSSYCLEHECFGRQPTHSAICTVHDHNSNAYDDNHNLASLELYPTSQGSSDFYTLGFFNRPAEEIEEIKFTLGDREYSLDYTQEFSSFDEYYYSSGQVPHLSVPIFADFDNRDDSDEEGTKYHYVHVTRLQTSIITVPTEEFIGLPMKLTVKEKDGPNIHGTCVLGDMNPGFRFDPLISDNSEASYTDGTHGSDNSDCNVTAVVVTVIVLLLVFMIAAFILTRRYYRPTITSNKSDRQAISQLEMS